MVDACWIIEYLLGEKDDGSSNETTSRKNLQKKYGKEY